MNFVGRGGACSSRRITIPPSFSCENATSLYTREALFGVSPYYLELSFMSVGVGAKRLRSKLYAERSEAARQTLIKISLHFARTTGGRPYRFGGFFNLMPVGEHSICSRKKKGRIWNPPLPVCEIFDVLIVGTGVPDGPRAIHESPLRVW